MLFGIMRSSDNELREFLFEQMCELVSALRQHMRKYLPDILQLCSECWEPALPLMPHILKLLSELSGEQLLSWLHTASVHLPQLGP